MFRVPLGWTDRVCVHVAFWYSKDYVANLTIKLLLPALLMVQAQPQHGHKLLDDVGYIFHIDIVFRESSETYLPAALTQRQIDKQTARRKRTQHMYNSIQN